MNMPGYTGNECLQKIKEIPKLSHIPVVILKSVEQFLLGYAVSSDTARSFPTHRNKKSLSEERLH
jgi:hypothetical protein